MPALALCLPVNWNHGTVPNKETVTTTLARPSVGCLAVTVTRPVFPGSERMNPPPTPPRGSGLAGGAAEPADHDRGRPEHPGPECCPARHVQLPHG